MEIYFFSKPYDKKEVRKKLERIGFRKDEEYGGYYLGRFGFAVNFTDDKEGRTQIQGFHLDNVWEKKKESKYYSTLEKLAHIFHPKKIIDPGFKNIFPELVEK